VRRSFLAPVMALITPVLVLAAQASMTTGGVAAQAACVADVEPNDQPAWTDPAASEVCIDGTLPQGDQDMFPWQVGDADLETRWTFSLSGIEDASTGLQLLRVTSEAGVEPVTVDPEPLLELGSSPDVAQAAPRGRVLVLPGRYILGVFRSPPEGVLDAPAVDYHVAIVRGDPMPARRETEPNDEASSGNPVAGAFETSGDASGAADHYAWDAPTGGPSGLWDVSLELPLGVYPVLTLTTGDGQRHASAIARDGRARLYDLAPGRYDIEVDSAGEAPAPYVLSATPSDPAAAQDAEPNDRVEWASHLDPARPVGRGRLAADGDVDTWRLSVDEEMAARQLDIRLMATSGRDRRLCIYAAAVTPLQCRSGLVGAVLSNLLLSPGEYVLEVSGEAELDAPYVLRLDSTSKPIVGYETEPNDTPDLASRADATAVMQGRGNSGDTDVFLVTVTGEPQLWQIDATGPALTSLEWWKGDGTVLATGDVADDGTGATLYDLYLVPGEHRIAIGADAGDYAMTATPLGPPDPNGEREPNNDVVRAERIKLGDTRTGKLRRYDWDTYRFSLAATEHVAFDLRTPDDAAIVLELEGGGQTLVETRGTAVDEDIHYEGILPAGDYTLWLRATQPSNQPYELSTRRLDPFIDTGDLEPNDVPGTARGLPASCALTGSGWGIGDPDFHRLPSWPGGSFVVDVGGSVTSVDLIQGDTQIRLTRDPEGDSWRAADVPAGPLVLWVSANGGYVIDATMSGIPCSSIPPDIEVALELPATEVAAWWPEGQHISGSVVLTNRSAAPVEVALAARTSHYDWTIDPPSAMVTIPAEGSARTPISVTVQPGAWADTPVAVAVRATPEHGPPASTVLEVVPRRDAVAVGPGQVWSLPATMLGGLDVAATALGGMPAGTVDSAGEAALHDGLAVGGMGLTVGVTDPPTPITVDLAGETAVPVTGIVINPASGLDKLSEKPRGFELLLSVDGISFEPALTGEISPLGIDQVFPLPAPVPARAARLLITSAWTTSLFGPNAGGSNTVIGEWKVVAQPGADPGPTPRDIADPQIGGHVVSMDPMPGIDPAILDGVLDADLDRSRSFPPKGAPVTWVIGFQHDRAAQITGLEWSDPVGSDPDSRSKRVTLEVSTDTPLGPWQALGRWDLERAADGSIPAYLLDTPTWARYIRFTVPGPRNEGDAWELPGSIRVLERPTDERYRSIVGEWGQLGSAGIRESLEPMPVRSWQDDPDVGVGADARELAAAATVSGRVATGVDIDEYTISVPDGHNSIRVVVGGEPFVGVSVVVTDSSGAVLPVTFGPGAVPGTTEYRASVLPTERYRLRVEQPAFSSVFLYDTSLSIFGYWQSITAAMDAFAAGVSPGREWVTIMPFDSSSGVLPDWSDQPSELRSAVEAALPVGGSSVERSILAALQKLASREGARAVLLVTDGETGSYGENADMWRGLEALRPLIFSVHIGGGGWPEGSTHLMQGLAASSGGAYQYVRTQDEMDRAFDRMATWLRRPAGYSLSYTTSTEVLPPPEPGSLRVVTPPDADGQPTRAPIDPDTAVEIILDTSGSMLQKIGGTRRIDAAKRVLVDLVHDDLVPGTPVALRWFEQKRNSCDTELAVPLGPLDPDSMATRIEDVRINKTVRTPLADAIDHVPDDLAGVSGRRIVVIVSDGRESCKGDPEASVQRLVDQGFDVTVNVVGLGVDSRTRKQIRRLASAGGGTYFDARKADQLDDAIGAALSAPVEVYDAAGALVGSGIVNGPALVLPPGTYRVVVSGASQVTFDSVVVTSDEARTLTLEANET
jgi:hypothetical protein